MHFQRLNQVCNLYFIDSRRPRDSPPNIQPGTFIVKRQSVPAALAFNSGGGAAAKWLFTSANCRALRPCKAVAPLSC